MKKLLLTILLITLLLWPTEAGATDTEMIYYGEMKLTAYCPCYDCSEGYARQTATQTIAEEGRTIAVDPDVISFGSKVQIGDSIYIAEDCGGAVNGDHIDIFVDDHEAVERFGVKYQEVWVIR